MSKKTQQKEKIDYCQYFKTKYKIGESVWTIIEQYPKWISFHARIQYIDITNEDVIYNLLPYKKGNVLFFTHKRKDFELYKTKKQITKEIIKRYMSGVFPDTNKRWVD